MKIPIPIIQLARSPRCPHPLVILAVYAASGFAVFFMVAILYSIFR